MYKVDAPQHTDHFHIELLLDGYTFKELGEEDCREPQCDLKLLERIEAILSGNLRFIPPPPDRLHDSSINNGFTEIDSDSQRYKLFRLAQAVKSTYRIRRAKSLSCTGQISFCRTKGVDQRLNETYKKIESLVVQERFLCAFPLLEEGMPPCDPIPLPDEIIIKILGYTHLKDLAAVASTNKHANRLAAAAMKVRAYSVFQLRTTPLVDNTPLKVALETLKMLRRMQVPSAQLPTKPQPGDAASSSAIAESSGKTTPTFDSCLTRLTDTLYNGTGEFVVVDILRSEELELFRRSLEDYLLTTNLAYRRELEMESITSASRCVRLLRELNTPRHLIEPCVEEKIDALCKIGVDPNQKAPGGRTALHSTVFRNAEKAMRILLENGADPNARVESTGITPGDLAEHYPHLLPSLLAYGACPRKLVDHVSAGDLNEARLSMIKSILAYARQRHREQGAEAGASEPRPFDLYVEELLDALHKFFIDHRKMYRQPISAENLYEIFVEEGFNINSEDQWGRTPLHYAVFNGNMPLVCKLIELKADPNHCEENGLTPTDLAVKNPKILDLLLKHGASPAGIKNSLLIAAVAPHNDESVKLLLQRKAPVNVLNVQGLSPLYYAVLEGLYDIAVMLLRHGAATGWTDASGSTVLFICPNEERFVSLLTSYGASASHINHTGDTPLHIAASKGHINTVKALLSHGADITALNHEDKSPLCLAEANEQAEVVKLLAQWIATHQQR